MSQREAPPPGVETVPEDVNEELDRIDRENEKKVLQKVMDDPDFGRRLMENPAEALASVQDEIGLVEEVEGHSHNRYYTKWRWKCYYSYYRDWAHYRRGVWRFYT